MFHPFTWRQTRALRRVIVLAFCAGLMAGGVTGWAAEAKTAFDLPADVLPTSMKRFAAQSGWEVLLPGDDFGGVRTKAVRGEMTSRQALDAMLVGTGLSVLQDTRSGAFTLRRKDPGPKGGRAAQKPESDRPGRQPNSTPNFLQHP